MVHTADDNDKRSQCELLVRCVAMASKKLFDFTFKWFSFWFESVRLGAVDDTYTANTIGNKKACVFGTKKSKQCVRMKEDNNIQYYICLLLFLLTDVRTVLCLKIIF